MLKLSGLFLFVVLISGAFSSSFAFAQIGPIAEDDFYSIDEDTLLTVNPIGVLVNDTNIDNSFFVIIHTDVGFGTLALNPDGSFIYLPNPNFNSVDSFSYMATNGTHSSNNATVTLTVNPVNDAPIAQNNTATTLENTPVIIPVLDNDSDVDGDSLTIISVTQGTNGTVTTNGTTVTYTPMLNFHGTDSFTYEISDGLLTDNATVSVTVNSINDAPIAQNNTATTLENTPVIIPVLDNDSDVDGDSLTIISVTQGTNGTVTTNGTTVTYTPMSNFHGTDSFTYEISDGLLTDNATVSVTVNSINDAPIAQNNTATTLENTPVIIPVLDNDSDVDGDSLTIISVTQGTNGTVTTNGTTVTYTPMSNFHGTDSFTYEISDGLLTDNATVTITVTSINNENDDGKVNICHKDKKTISVSVNAIPAHLKHGDTLGACGNENSQSTDKKVIKEQLKDLKNDLKAQEKIIKEQLKALKKDFKAQEKELKDQLKDLKKDNKSKDKDHDDDNDEDHDEDDD